MSFNFLVKRVCAHCKKEFDAQRITTRYCSKNCNNTNYKLIAKQKKIAESNSVTFRTMTKIKEPIKDKEYLTVKEASSLLNISIRTIYRLIERNDINSFNFTERNTIIRRKDIDFYFDANLKILEKNKLDIVADYNFENSYTVKEAQEKYNISSSALYNLTQRFKIPKKKHGKFTLIKKEHLDQIFK